MNLIRYIYHQSKRLFLLSILGALLSGFVGASLVGMISRKVEGSTYSSNMVWAFFAGCLIFFISKTLAELALLNLTQSAILSLRIDLSKKLLSTPIKTLRALGDHGLLAVLTKDIETFAQSFMLIPMVLGNAILVIACFSYLAWVSWPSFIILSVLLGLAAYGFHLAEKRPLELMSEVRERLDDLYLNFQSLINGSKELQLNRQKGQAFIHQVISPGVIVFRKYFIKSSAGYTCIVNAGAVVFYLIIGMMIFILPLWLPLEPGVLITIALIVLFLVGPVSEMMGAMPILRQAGVALKKMQQLDDTLHACPETPSKIINPFLSNEHLSLELNQVLYRYCGDIEDSYFVLGPLDLKVTQGEVIFIAGGNGSGKTTMAMLLVGLFEPDSGFIRLNGVDVTVSNQEHYRQFFSAVFSDFHLFEQLLTTEPHMTEKANHYINALDMGHKVNVVDGRFSTISLSTGQRKRLALVSAYLEDRPIYLFDEWAADQDPVFKKVFYTELLPELKSQGKTIIVITHDDAYFPYSDRVIFLENGHFKEQPKNNSHSDCSMVKDID